MKFAGFLTGAGVAAIAVWGFNSWRDISDMDRVTAIIGDHCLPYVQFGTAPFQDMGRPVGVYDEANLSDSVTGGGNAIIYDNRFVAQWGESTDVNSAVRVCSVADSYVMANSVGFVVDTPAIADWIEGTVLAEIDLVATSTALGSVPSLLIWEPPAQAERFSGLRIILNATENSVSSVLILDDLPD
ncbi:MAG: hypothetical protein KIH44_006200 [Octadecabacter sp.]|nr:hypothetical protein [Octadecabacter sp.]